MKIEVTLYILLNDDGLKLDINTKRNYPDWKISQRLNNTIYVTEEIKNEKSNS